MPRHPAARAAALVLLAAALPRAAQGQEWDAFAFGLYASTIAGEYEVRHRTSCMQPDADRASCRDVRPLPPVRGAAARRSAAPQGALLTRDAARQELGETLAHRVALAELAAAPALKSRD